MTLFVIFIALACERLLSHLRRWREYDWMGRYLDRLQEISLAEPLWTRAAGLVFLLPPLVGIFILQVLLAGKLLGLLGLVFAVLILIFSLGPRDLWEEVHALVRAREQGDASEATLLARDLCAVAGRRPNQAAGRSVVRAVVIQGNERLLGVLLWFFVLGPLGAALYRMSAELPAKLRERDAGAELIEAALRLHGLLAWVPIRLVALLYGLAGNTDGALNGWRSARAVADPNWVQHGWRLLADTGSGALEIEQGEDHHRVNLGLDETLNQALGLITRSLILLLAVLAAFTIGGWIA